MACHGARAVHILDLNPPDDQSYLQHSTIHFHQCNVASWEGLRQKFQEIGDVHLAFANAGISEHNDYFQDELDDDGLLLEPKYDQLINVNLRAVINFVKLSWSAMRRQGTGGSIVITTSATAYAPEQSLPVYAGAKLAVSGVT